MTIATLAIKKKPSDTFENGSCQMTGSAFWIFCMDSGSQFWESILVQMPVRDAHVPVRIIPCHFFPRNLQRDGKSIEATWQII